MAPVTGIEGEYRWYRMRISAARADGIDSRYTRYREGQLLNKEIKLLLKEALTSAATDRQVYMKGIDASYRYEGYATYSMDELDH